VIAPKSAEIALLIEIFPSWNGEHESGRPQYAPQAPVKETTVPKNGKRLNVLSALALASVLYSVKPGDTLSGIAQHYNTTWEAIYDANQSAIHNPNVIYAGQQLHVSEGDLATGLAPVQAVVPQPSASSHPSYSAPVRSYNVTHAAVYTPAQSTSHGTRSGDSAYGSSALDSIPGVPQSFAACVAYRESTNNTNPAAHGDAYGIIPASGYDVSGDSVAQQKQVFEKIYSTTGPRAWAADGC
jgi:LysM repeat protein